MIPKLYAFDASSANKTEKTGVEWYAYQIIEQLKKHPLESNERVILYSPSKLEADLSELPKQWQSQILKWPLSRGWMQGRVSWEMLRRAPEVLFVPSQGLPRIRGKAKTINTIHDLGPLRLPQMYQSGFARQVASVTKRSVKKADKLFAVSEFTKQELVDYYKIPADKIVVTPNAADQSVYKKLDQTICSKVLDQHRLGQNFFLSVGRITAHKNIGTLIRAFEIFKSERGAGDPFELVIVGNPGFGASQVKELYEYSPHKDSIRMLGYLEASEIAALMNCAQAFLSPSYYEGFGVPNLEAMACGCPVIASDIPVFKEVCGQAATFAAPSEPEAWALAMKRLVADPAAREQMKLSGFENVKRYSWDKTADIVLREMRKMT
ncbi:glycosyltransferase family 4 protein [Patescibacteria group bacterium]